MSLICRFYQACLRHINGAKWWMEQYVDIQDNARVSTTAHFRSVLEVVLVEDGTKQCCTRQAVQYKLYT